VEFVPPTLPSTLRVIVEEAVGILATETSPQILRILRIPQLKLRVQLVGNRVTGTWLYKGLMPALLKQLNQSMHSILLRNNISNIQELIFINMENYSDLDTSSESEYESI
jgi:hypothetical protein